MTARRARPPKYNVPTTNLSLRLPDSIIACLDAEGYGQRSAAVARILAAHYNIDLNRAA
jgi:hypothetical protein